MFMSLVQALMMSFIFAFAFIGIGGPLYAQDQPSKANDIVLAMKAQLDLTQDQLTAITPIVEKYFPQDQKLRKSAVEGAMGLRDMRIQMKLLRKSERQELGQVLSADQIGLWERMQRKMDRQDDHTADDPAQDQG